MTDQTQAQAPAATRVTLDDVRTAVLSSGIPTNKLCFEITETTCVSLERSISDP